MPPSAAITVCATIHPDGPKVCQRRQNTKMTPLLWAARKEHHKVEKLLLKHGANLELADAGAGPPLHYACSIISSVKTLLDAGADVNAKNKGPMLPSAASMKFFQGYIRFLRSKDCRAHRVNQKGETADGKYRHRNRRKRDISRQVYAHSQRIRIGLYGMLGRRRKQVQHESPRVQVQVDRHMILLDRKLLKR